MRLRTETGFLWKKYSGQTSRNLYEMEQYGEKMDCEKQKLSTMKRTPFGCISAVYQPNRKQTTVKKKKKKQTTLSALLIISRQ